MIGRFLLDCRLSLRLAAQSSLGLFFKIIDVTVVLNDVNDNAPTFTPSVTELTIMESASVGSLFQVSFLPRLRVLQTQKITPSPPHIWFFLRREVARPDISR